MIDPDETTLTDADVETVVRGSAGSVETDPDTTDDTDTGDTDESDADDDATDDGGGDTDSTDS